MRRAREEKQGIFFFINDIYIERHVVRRNELCVIGSKARKYLFKREEIKEKSLPLRQRKRNKWYSKMYAHEKKNVYEGNK